VRAARSKDVRTCVQIWSLPHPRRSRAQQHLFGIGKRELCALESILSGQPTHGFADIDRQPQGRPGFRAVGKYIAPQPIEQLIKGSRFVNQVVVIGNERKFASALIVPDWEQLEAYAKYKGLDGLNSHADFCHSPRIIDLFERQIAARTQSLAQFEKIKKIALLDHEFTVEGGEMTPTLKVKRRVIDEKYRAVIDRLYFETIGLARDGGGDKEVIGG